MSAITSVTPHTSIKTGNIAVRIEGSDFLTPDASKLFSQPAFYSPVTLNGGTVSSPSASGVKLSVSNSTGGYAAVELDTLFGPAFDVTIGLDTTIDTLPAIDDATLFALRAEDDNDSSVFFDVSVRYKDSIGYYVVITKEGIPGEEETYQRAIGPYEISALRLYRSGSRITAYVVVDGDTVRIGDFNSVPSFDAKLVTYISNSSTLHTASFSIWLKKFTAAHAVSFANQPGKITNVQNTIIDFITVPGEPTSGYIYIGFPDGTSVWGGAGLIAIYSEDELVRRISNNADMAISVYQQYVNPTRDRLFTEAGGFTWDEDEFLASGRGNNNLYVPSLWDPRTYNVPIESFQSGHGFADNIKYQDIVKLRRESEEKWHARLNHGTYFVRNADYYLFSEESVTTRLEDEKTEDGRSLKSLHYLPKHGVPVSVSTLKFDVRSGNIVENKRFQKRIKFTGKVSNGVELDAEYVDNIDTTLNEFIVHYNSNNMVTKWKIPAVNANAGLYSFMLDEVPLFDYPIIFTRKDIFKQQKYVAKKYNDPEAIYGKFKYGTGPQQPGDWTVDYNTGEVIVWLDQNYIELGYVTYTFDYPAMVEFNNNYLVDKGYGITNPTVTDLPSLSRLGESDGTAGQIFTVPEFPIYDLSKSEYFDTTSFRLFVYDPSTLTFDTGWTRVKTFEGTQSTDKVFMLDADAGTVTFGNDINGLIPHKYFRILAAYRVSVRVEYEPSTSVDYWTAKSVDLNLSRNNLNSGFLYLTRREQIPDNISLSFSDGVISALEFSTLTATVYDLEGEVMSGVEVEFNIEGGMTEDESVVTDSDGIASTIFIPDSSIEAMGIFINAFEAGSDFNTKGDYIEGAYQNNGAIVNAKLICPEVIVDDPSEIYVFKILDNDDAFNPYDNSTRKGGTYQVYYKNDGSSNVLIRPSAVNGRVMVFDEPLPQSFDPTGPNYEPDIRGFCIVAKKRIKATAKTTYKGMTIQSQAAYLRVAYSPIQKGEWTLPILPVAFDGSEIDRATYITINP